MVSSAVSGAAEVALAAFAFYKFFNFVACRILSEENADKWRVRRAVRLDIACKFVSSCFAMFATAAGLALMTSGENWFRDPELLEEWLYIFPVLYPQSC